MTFKEWNMTFDWNTVTPTNIFDDTKGDLFKKTLTLLLT